MRRILLTAMLLTVLEACALHSDPPGTLVISEHGPYPHMYAGFKARHRNPNISASKFKFGFDGFNIHIEGMERELAALSEQEFELFLHGTPEQQWKIAQKNWYTAAADEILREWRAALDAAAYSEPPYPYR